MGFSSKIYNCVDLMIIEDLCNEGIVRNFPMYEYISWITG